MRAFSTCRFRGCSGLIVRPGIVPRRRFTIARSPRQSRLWGMRTSVRVRRRPSALRFKRRPSAVAREEARRAASGCRERSPKRRFGDRPVALATDIFAVPFSLIQIKAYTAPAKYGPRLVGEVGKWATAEPSHVQKHPDRDRWLRRCDQCGTTWCFLGTERKRYA